MAERDEVGGHSGTVHQASDQLIDPWCEVCFTEQTRKTHGVAHCVECNTIYCSPCLENHNKFPQLKNHRILRGAKMPKSQADKPVRYPTCKIHVAEFNNHYCLKHHEMVCGECMKQDHKICNALSISDVCQNLGTQDIEQFRKEVVHVQQNTENTKSVLEQNISDLKIQKDDLIKAAKEERDQVVAKADELFEETVSKITKSCRPEKSRIADNVATLADEIHSLDKIIENIDKLAAFSVDQNTFIQMQQIVENVKKHQREIEEMTKHFHHVSLSFASSKEISSFLTECKELGNVILEKTPLDVRAIPDIVFPQSSRQKTYIRRQTRDLTQLRAMKRSTINVQTTDDKSTCDIKGMDIDRNDTLFLTDYDNKSLKLMSRDNKIISCYPLDSEPVSVKVIDNTTAVVNVTE